MNCTQQTDSFITGGKRGSVEGWGKDLEKCPKTGEREEGRGKVGGIGSRWKEDGRKESVLGEASGKER